MACSDGVYDKLANEDVAQCFWDILDKTDDKDKYQSIGKVPSKVIEKSMEKLSMDNLTSLVIMFEDHGKLMLPSKKIPKTINEKESTFRRPYSSNNEANLENNKPSNKSNKNDQKTK